MGKLIWRTFSIEATGKWYTEDSYKELEQKLSDSEADWIKMREIAEETQRKLAVALQALDDLGKNLPLSCTVGREAVNTALEKIGNTPSKQ